MKTAVERSLATFPAGSNGEFDLPPEFSQVITSGSGCRLTTTDGQSMLDMSMGWGSVLAGHSHPRIVDAVRKQLERGTNFSYVSERSLELAEELIHLSAATERIRFCASGTEATMYCVRLARAFRNRPKILKFEGAYHGAHDLGVVSLFPNEPPDYPQGQSSSDGISPASVGDVLVAPYNDLDAVSKIIERHHDELAGVIVEPLQRCLRPSEGFLEGLRDLTHRYGLSLIFDEVVTGFRLAYGGAQEYYEVIPDLVAYGKALSSGFALGAFGGRAEIMQIVEEHRMGREVYVWTASTLGGNPIAAAAALAALDIYREEVTYARLRHLGHHLREGMRSALKEVGVEGVVLGDGPLAQVAFTQGPVRDYRSSQHTDKRFARRVMLDLFANGVFLNPMGTKLYLSLAHDEFACDEFCDKFEQALRR